MVKQSDPERLDLIFGALADPTRRAMVRRLEDGECSVGELGQPFSISAPAVSKHLRVLERAGLVVQEAKGRVRICRLMTKPLDEARAWLAGEAAPLVQAAPVAKSTPTPEPKRKPQAKVQAPAAGPKQSRVQRLAHLLGIEDG